MAQKTTEVSMDWQHRLLRNGIYGLLLFMPFYALISVWLAKLGFDYDFARLIKEFVLFGLAALALWLVYKNKKFSEWFAGDNLIKLILVFILVALISAAVVLITDAVSPRAVGFGLIVDTRMWIFMLVVMIAVKSKVLLPVPRWVVLPAIAVIGFGLMQMTFLPADFLERFGYSDATIKAYQAVDNNPDYVRVQSTMRGPNPLGAYLIPVLMLLTVGVAKFKNYKWQFITAIVAGLTVLFGTYSRSAWVGAAVAGGLLLGWQLKTRARKTGLLVLVALALITSSGVYVLRDNDFVQNTVFHSSEKSPSTISSNEARFNSLESGMKDIFKEPLGGGIGSAGPASVYNAERGQRQSENFYIQIGRELGLIGLGLYLAITGVVITRLWQQRQNTIVQAVLAAFIGLIIINMLSHAWSDDTLAYIFGALLAYAFTAYKTSTKHEY